jgi:hypothetical protein
MTPTNDRLKNKFKSYLKDFPSDTDKMDKSKIKIFSEFWFLIH